MVDLVFLEAKLGRLSKTVTPRGVEPYPNAAQFRSHHVEAPDLLTVADAMRSHAAQGHCLHVGNLARPLVDWGKRAGLADRNSGLRWLTLDIDGLGLPSPITPPLDATQFAITASRLIQQELPQLAQTACIAQASAKMGLNPNRISMHLFYLLDEPLTPTQLKAWLKWLNFENDTFRRGITLNATGHALKWPLDISSVDYGRLIYIAPPTFDSVPNPFTNDADRIVVIAAPQQTLRGVDICSVEAGPRREVRMKNELRDLAGLPRENARIRTMTIGSERVELLLNPAQGILRPYATARGFCYYNLNDGDSGAYYHPEGRPDIISNFKGEPAFRFQDVDPDGYTRYCEENAEAIARANPINTFAVINQSDDQIYKVWHDREQDLVTVVKSQRSQIEDFYAEYGRVEPAFIPTWQIDHWPRESFTVDYNGKCINQFRPSELMKAGQQRIYDRPITAEDPTVIREVCPNIWFLLSHMTGNGEKELYYFLNWLACIFQKRKKTGSAIVLQGAEGTGKGMFYQRIAERLFGAENVTQKSNNDLDDTFTGWRRGKLLVCFDEFEIPNTTNGRKQLALLRSWITEARPSVREMRQEGRDREMYDNFLFLTNQYAILPITENERRYTVCPRQDTPLKTICDTIKLRDAVIEEVPEFASTLHAFICDENLAMQALNNESKALVRESAATVVEEFARALRDGDVDFMLNIFESVDIGSPSDIIALEAARRTVLAMLRSYQDERPVFVETKDLCNLYNAMFDENMSVLSVSKLLSRRGLTPVRGDNDKGRTRRGIYLKMTHCTLTAEQITALLEAPPSHLRLVGAAT